MRISSKSGRFAALAMVAALGLAACGSDDKSSTDTTMGANPQTTDAVDTSTICDTDGLVDAIQNGPAAGTTEGMTNAPVGTAASNNPVLTTLVTAVTKADLVNTLNDAAALTVFAPTDCAFAQLDPATLEAALADPQGLLTTVLGFHVITERLSPEDLAGKTELTTFTGETLSVSVDGDAIRVGDQANVVVADVQTANATVYLIDTVMIPPSVG